MFLQSKFYKHLRGNNFYFFVAFCFFFEAAASFLSRLQKQSKTRLAKSAPQPHLSRFLPACAFFFFMPARAPCWTWSATASGTDRNVVYAKISL